MMLARAGMLICPNGRPLLGSLVSYFYSWLSGVVPELPSESDLARGSLEDFLYGDYRNFGEVSAARAELSEALYVTDVSQDAGTVTIGSFDDLVRKELSERENISRTMYDGLGAAFGVKVRRPNTRA